MEEVEPVQIAITPYGLKVPTDWSCFCVFWQNATASTMTCNLPSISQLGPRSTGQLCKPRGMLLTFASRLHATQMQSDIIPVASSPSTHTHTMHLQWLWNLILPCWNQQTIWKIGHWLTSRKLKHLPCKCSGRMKSRDLWKVAPVASWDALSESWSAFFCYLVGRWLNLQRTLLLQIRDSNHHPNGFQTPSKI